MFNALHTRASELHVICTAHFSNECVQHPLCIEPRGMVWALNQAVGLHVLHACQSGIPSVSNANLLSNACNACRVFHKPLLVHVISETWGMGMHLYLRAIGFKHAVMGVSHRQSS